MVIRLAEVMIRMAIQGVCSVSLGNLVDSYLTAIRIYRTSKSQFSIDCKKFKIDRRIQLQIWAGRG